MSLCDTPVRLTPSRVALNVSLTPELQDLIHDKVASGRCQSASEVVRAGLRLLEGEQAKEVRVAFRTPIDFERGRRKPQSASLQAIEAALGRLGVELIERDGAVGILAAAGARAAPSIPPLKRDNASVR